MARKGNTEQRDRLKHRNERVKELYAELHARKWSIKPGPGETVKDIPRLREERILLELEGLVYLSRATIDKILTGHYDRLWAEDNKITNQPGLFDNEE